MLLDGRVRLLEANVGQAWQEIAASHDAHLQGATKASHAISVGLPCREEKTIALQLLRCSHHHKHVVGESNKADGLIGHQVVQQYLLAITVLVQFVQHLRQVLGQQVGMVSMVLLQCMVQGGRRQSCRQ